MKSTIHEPGSDPPCPPGPLTRNHKKALRFSTNKSQQLWSLPFKYANYCLTFVNKMFPSLLRLTPLSYLRITLRTSFTRESGDYRASRQKEVHPPLLPWSGSGPDTDRPDSFLPKALPLGSPEVQLGPSTFCLSLQPGTQQPPTALCDSLCLRPGSPQDWAMMSSVSCVMAGEIKD